MSCSITTGRADATCKDNVGGIKTIYLFDYDKSLIDNLTISNRKVTAHASTSNVFQVDLNGANNGFEEAGEVSRDNGTVFYNQTLTAALKKQDSDTADFLDILAKGRPHAIVEDYNGNLKLAGIENGLDVQVSVASGGAMGDFSGYNISLTGQERNLAPFVDSALVAAAAEFDVQAAQIS